MKKLSETYKELGIAHTFPIIITTIIRDVDGYQTYCEDSDGYCEKWERDAKGRETYYENSRGQKRGTPRSAKTCEGKVMELDGVKYKLTTIEEIKAL